MVKNLKISVIVLICLFSTFCNNAPNRSVSQIFSQIEAQEFHPLSNKNTFTSDKNLEKHGIADLSDTNWKVRLLAVRDLVRIGSKDVGEVIDGLNSSNMHVRAVCATALGILKAQNAITELEYIVKNDTMPIVRSQAVIALGQIESKKSLPLLKRLINDDPSGDVQHQCELAIDQIQKEKGATKKQLLAYQKLDESLFESVKTGDFAPDFKLEDTESEVWKLSSFKEKNWVVLIWVFADWCPVCHSEFNELMEMQNDFEKEGVQVFTMECHDRFRGRVMVGKELDPTYWFAKKSFQKAYTEQIWWPHLLDLAGSVGAMYGVDPMAFAVHSEYINRPSTIIIDPAGVVRLAYCGTSWSDRPTIKQTLEMIKTGNFEFEKSKHK
jgi:peroxiredoxin